MCGVLKDLECWLSLKEMRKWSFVKDNGAFAKLQVGFVEIMIEDSTLAEHGGGGGGTGRARDGLCVVGTFAGHFFSSSD